MGKIVFIRNKNNAFITVDGVTKIITDNDMLLLPDLDIVRNILERRGKHGTVKQINNSQYSYQ